jgi:hypothetical protein
MMNERNVNFQLYFYFLNSSFIVPHSSFLCNRAAVNDKHFAIHKAVAVADDESGDFS